MVNATILFTFLVACLLALPCLCFLLFHLRLVATGRTLYEWQQVRAGTRPATRSLFDYGTLNNFALTLGVYPLVWVLPIRQGIEGNGIFFPEQERAASAGGGGGSSKQW